jgi:hypothetical protein
MTWRVKTSDLPVKLFNTRPENPPIAEKKSSSGTNSTTQKKTPLPASEQDAPQDAPQRKRGKHLKALSRHNSKRRQREHQKKLASLQRSV